MREYYSFSQEIPQQTFNDHPDLRVFLEQYVTRMLSVKGRCEGITTRWEFRTYQYESTARCIGEGYRP